MIEYIQEFPIKIERLYESKDEDLADSTADNLLFKNFQDRFKTWEQLRAERYFC